MIITQEKSKRVVSSHDFDSVECTIDAEDMRYVASLLRNNYSNPPLAVVREISANALDANNEAKATRKVEVTIPSKFNPHFCVRDFGNGLSQEDVFGLYSKYGKSTKRNSNSYIGAFGIGKFAPLSYGNNFTCVSFHEGIKTSYNVFVNEDDDTKIVKMHEETSKEPSGLSVEVAIADEDIDTFRTIVKAFFRFFSDEDMPKFIGVGDDEEFFDKYDIVLEANDKSWFIIDDQQDYWSRSHSESHAFMGRVHYPMQSNSINFSSIIDEDIDGNEIHALQEICRQDNLYIRFDIGELKLHHSRESLEYNKVTQKAIVEHLRQVKNDIEELAKEKLEGATCLWDAKAKYAQVVNALPHSLKGIFENSFKWKGIPITSFAFNRPYSYHDSIIITEYTKQDDSLATDGYRVRSKKTSNIYVQKNNRLMFQDLKTPHGNALRARNIFNTDEFIEAVYVVSSDTNGAENYIFTDDDGWRFDLINDENMFKTSTTEKAKLKQGTRASGESRASVPTFIYEPRGYRMRDQWSNGAEVDDLEKELEDDAKLVYIPITNYKPSEASYDLEGLKRQYNGVASLLKTLDSESSPLHGIRVKDVSNLDKSKWIKWDDYRIELAKKHLLDHKNELLRGEKAIAYKEHRHHMNHVNALESLIANKAFLACAKKDLQEDHDVVEASMILRDSQNSNNLVETLYSLKKLVMAEDKDWYDANLSIKYNWKTFNYLCKDISEKYPLLVNISKEVYGWQSMTEHNLGKNITDYISMCDKLGDEA